MTVTEPVLRGEREVYPIDQFAALVHACVGNVRDLWIEGEVTSLKRVEGWAMVFLTLKGIEGAQVNLAMFRSQFDRLPDAVAVGELVHAYGQLDFYAPSGTLSFRASALERAGAGDQRAAFEALKRKLAAEGLFAPERKRPLPRFPRAVGLLTGTKGAARGDVLTALAARYPAMTVVILETRVQGATAPPAIAAGLARLAEHPEVDVVIVARGGGSAEDLATFDDEQVVRAVAACPVPVVSAIGHEQDWTLCDLVADVRAATPTAAPRLVVPDAAELRADLVRARERAALGLRRQATRQRERLDRRRDCLRAAPRLLLERRRAALATASARLQALSPSSTLQRGYAIVRSGGAAVRDAASLAPGAEVAVQLAHGGFAARVENTHP
ncbi:MAG: exodeoxyribonuclease VII large subunit [Thermoleophilia bacterium]|nr:exodeoxyribonuclease VII large subunit [Thermoleophilia bacterium]